MLPTPQGVSPIAHLTDGSIAQSSKKLNLVDRSLQPRYGCKGSGTAAWLTSMGLAIPNQPNSALISKQKDVLVLRLGQNEFLVEADATRITTLYAAPRQANVYPVLRQDACFELAGEHLNNLLLQTCNVNFLALDTQTMPVVLTSMAGVSVIALPALNASPSRCHIWCDGTFAPYLWRTLTGIATELESGANAS